MVINFFTRLGTRLWPTALARTLFTTKQVYILHCVCERGDMDIEYNKLKTKYRSTCERVILIHLVTVDVDGADIV